MSEGTLWWVGLAILGFVVGTIAGMFGVGGGFLMTPLLAILFRLPYPVAVGTGLCQMIGVATSAFLRHQKLGQGEVKIDWLMLLGSLLGVGLGARTVSALDTMGNVAPAGHVITYAKLFLSLGYIMLLSVVAFWMGRDARRISLPVEMSIPPGPLARIHISPMTRLPHARHTVSAPLIAYLGLFMGFLSGLLGIGGGVALMPILLYGIGMRIRMAAGTGILVLLATSLTGTFSYALSGRVRLDIALTLLIGATIGAQIGATLTHRISGQKLRGGFVYIILLTIAAVIWDLIYTLTG